MAIDEDMLFPPCDCEADHKLTANRGFRVIHSYAGHFGLFGLEPTFFKQIDFVPLLP